LEQTSSDKEKFVTEAIVVLCTCASEQEALQLANTLVEKRLAACVNVLSPIRSVYRWQGKIEDASEYLLLIKSTGERFPALRDAIVQLHSYDTPEILAISVAAGAERYLAWIAESV
jgi:periplasmic divalent cation tolerance protein